MKSRVALAATLITLLALVLLVVLSCISIVEERNDRLSDDVELALRLVSETAPSGTDAESFSALSQYLRKHGLQLRVYTQKGEAIYASDGAGAPLTDTDFGQTGKGLSGRI